MLSKKLTILVCLMGLVLSGCVQFTRTGNLNLQSRPADCDFSVYTIPPQGYYEEIGVIEFQGNFFEGKVGGPSSIRAVKKKAARDVCSAGGNGLLLWESNGLGAYKKATVIHVEH